MVARSEGEVLGAGGERSRELREKGTVGVVRTEAVHLPVWKYLPTNVS